MDEGKVYVLAILTWFSSIRGVPCSYVQIDIDHCQRNPTFWCIHVDNVNVRQVFVSFKKIDKYSLVEKPKLQGSFVTLI
jgi:hypothetical protein